MRSLLEVLREKEKDLARVRHEVEALRFVAPLLLERGDAFSGPSEVLRPEPLTNRWPLEVEEPSRRPRIYEARAPLPPAGPLIQPK